MDIDKNEKILDQSKKIDNREIKSNQSKIDKNESFEFYNLMLFDKDLNVEEMINFSNKDLTNHIFNDELFCVELSVELFFKIKDLLKTNTLKLTKNPIDFKITIDDIIATPLPPEPPTKDELMSKAILDQMIKFEELDEKTSSISSNLDNESLKQKNMEQKIRLLSKAILDLTIKSV